MTADRPYSRSRLLGFVGMRVRRALRKAGPATAGRRPDLLERLRSTLRKIVPVPAAAGAMAHEIAFLHYAFLSWRSRPDVEEGELAFSYHRRNGYAGVLVAVGLAALVEMVAVHALASTWSATLAWALTGISAYGMIWLAGFFQAVRLRPILLTPDSLLVRIGLLWSVRVPYDLVSSVAAPAGAVPDRRAKGYLHAVTLGPPRLLVELRDPVEVEGLYGFVKRGVTLVGLSVDDLGYFAAELRARTGLAP